MAIGAVIYNRLHDDSAIAAVVGTNILPEYRDDVVPALAYEMDIDSADQMYEGVGFERYDLSIHCVAATYDAAVSMAQLVKTRLADADWTDGTWRVLGCFWRNKTEDLIEATTKNQRLAVVSCHFDFLIANTDGL